MSVLLVACFSEFSPTGAGTRFLCKVKAPEGRRGGVVPTEHKQRYAAQGDPKGNAEIAQKARPYRVNSQAHQYSSGCLSGGQAMHLVCIRGSTAFANSAYSTMPTVLQGKSSSPLRLRADCTRQSSMRNTTRLSLCSITSWR